MIEDIIRLATIVMVIDNETDDSEMSMFTQLPKLMSQYLENRAGVTMKISIGGKSKVIKDKNDLDSESAYNLSGKEISDIANKTIAEFNTIDESENELWIYKIADNIKGKWVRFHTLRFLVDIASADKIYKKEELQILQYISKAWDMNEDILDFLFLKTKTEWMNMDDLFIDTKKKLKYF